MSSHYPEIRPLGLDALIVRFSGSIDDAANRAALTFAALVGQANWQGVEEVAPSLTSCMIRFDPLDLDFDVLVGSVERLLSTRDWTDIGLPGNRRIWRIPVALGGDEGPQFNEAAAIAGQNPDDLRDLVADTTLRVLALGFAPGQPYMGFLPEDWNIPRQESLTPQVNAGALVMAVRQLIIYAMPAPTGWRQIGLTGFRPFRPDHPDPITLRAGDEVSFKIVQADELDGLDDGLGGATCQEIS